MRPARRPSFRPEQYRGVPKGTQEELQTEAIVRDRAGVYPREVPFQEADTVVVTAEDREVVQFTRPDLRVVDTPEEATDDIEITPIDAADLELINAEDEIDTVVVSKEHQEAVAPRKALQSEILEQATTIIPNRQPKSPSQYAYAAEDLKQENRQDRDIPRIETTVQPLATAQDRRTPEERQLQARERAQDVYAQQRVNTTSNPTTEAQRLNEQRLDAALGVYEQFTKAATDLRRTYDETRWTSPVSKAYSWLLWRNTRRNMDKYRDAYPEMVRMINSGKRSKGLSRRLSQQQYNAERAHDERLKRR